jgi:surface polysaccharide O-acyltransferase-like enzyme
MGIWPAGAGPAWFLWVLLAFDALAVVLFRTFPRFPVVLERGAAAEPRILCGRLVAVSALAYIPLAIAFGPGTWNAIGPFKLQVSRVLLYLVYFLAGCGVGTHGMERGLLATNGSLARRWDRWLGVALAAFPLAVGFGFAAAAAGPFASVLATAGYLAFVMTCAAASFAALALSLRLVSRRVAVLDHLRDNAYAIYVVHFVFVSWLQYALRPAQLSALTKGSLVFLGAVASSWAVSAALRRVPAIARVV